MSTASDRDRGVIFNPRFVTPYDPNYPDTDGKPMAESTWQWDWIVTIAAGIKDLFRDDPNVFVASDLLWYPVFGEPKTCTAPDVMVVFGRPKGHRYSYMAWWEEEIGPQVVFEVVSHNNRPREMKRNLEFYERFGVEEYYLYNPNAPQYFRGYLRHGDRLEPIPDAYLGWTSPRLGVLFRLRWDGHLEMFGPDSSPFRTFQEMCEEIAAERARGQELVENLDDLRRMTDIQGQEAEAAIRQADTANRHAEAERQRAERLAAKLRALGIDPDEA